MCCASLCVGCIPSYCALLHCSSSLPSSPSLFFPLLSSLPLFLSLLLSFSLVLVPLFSSTRLGTLSFLIGTTCESVNRWSEYAPALSLVTVLRCYYTILSIWGWFSRIANVTCVQDCLVTVLMQWKLWISFESAHEADILLVGTIRILLSDTTERFQWKLWVTGEIIFYAAKCAILANSYSLSCSWIEVNCDDVRSMATRSNYP